MLPLPSVMEPIVLSLSAAFTEPTFNRFAALCVGAILARGRRTVTGILHGASGMVPAVTSATITACSAGRRGRCGQWARHWPRWSCVWFPTTSRCSFQ